MLLWTYFFRRIGFSLIARQFERTCDVLAIAFEYRPAPHTGHQQKIVGVDFDQETVTRIVNHVEKLLHCMIGAL